MRSTLLLLLVGVLFAGGLGFAAHVVAQDTVGTPAVDLDQGEPLAPEEARDDDRTESTTTTTTETEPQTTTEAEDPDDETGATTTTRAPAVAAAAPGRAETMTRRAEVAGAAAAATTRPQRSPSLPVCPDSDARRHCGVCPTPATPHSPAED